MSVAESPVDAVGALPPHVGGGPRAGVAPALVLDHVTKSFDTERGTTLHVLKGISLSLFGGEFVSIIGPSGCGKSTLLYLVSGLEKPSAGSIVSEGVTVHGPGRDRGLVFQHDVILGWRTVVRNVEYGLELRGVPREERRATALRYLKLVGLSGYENLYPKELSGGMKKRVQIAAVFANNPKMLLMDEPFGSLDYPTKIGLQRQLQDIWLREHKLALFVTHDLEEAIFMSTKVVAMRDGVAARVYDVPFPFPRDDTLRVDGEFQRCKKDLWEFLDN